MEADAKEGLAASAGSALPTEAGFYWWRPAKPSAWRMIKVRSVPGFPAHSADDVSHGSFIGRPIRGWAEDWPVGEWSRVQSPNSGMNDSQSHQPSMTSEQLDRFQDWLNREAVEANNKSGAYFNGRACAFNDAFECLAILRMKASQTPESTETDKSQSAS